MRDQGLEEAIRAVGSITELARRIGISQPAVSNWNRIPAERVLSVEAVTGVERRVLRPDLFGETAGEETLDTTDIARAQEYALLATLMARSPDAELLARLARLGGDQTPLGLIHAAVADAAARTDAARVEREYFNLFVGVGRGELLPYASYYLTGFLYERPLARLRADLRRLGIEQVEGLSEPEDHASFLCEVMAGLTGGAVQAAKGADRDVFQAHLAPWLGRFFADLEHSATAQFYACVGRLGRTFMEIETEAFALSDVRTTGALNGGDHDR
jgi:TorA maturation chaperone TorD